MPSGLVLGKFLPPHKGHEFLINFAKEHVDKLFIVVDNISDEIIPVTLRMNWLKEICPGARVLTLKKQLPQYPEEAENFWEQWENGLKEILPEKIDYVFASENYGEILAQVLQAEFKMFDIKRQNVNISASDIRKNPFHFWDFISDCAKPYFVKKICVFGPESTGKSTLTQKLAQYFHTDFVEEYARKIIEKRNGNLKYEDMTVIAKGHDKDVCFAAVNADKMLFVDTDAITSKIWSIKLFGRYPKILDDIIEKTDYDLYILLDVDVPWVDDIVRYFPDERREFFNLCESELKKYGKKYVIISGDFEERFEKSIKAIEENILCTAKTR